MKVETKPELCSPLSVIANSQGSLCLLSNLRYLNQFLHFLSFKYEDLRIAALMFEQGEYNYVQVLFKVRVPPYRYHMTIVQHPSLCNTGSRLLLKKPPNFYEDSTTCTK